MKDLVDTKEMYLRTIYELEEEGIVPLRARISERLSQSGPTVSQTVSRMERDGLVAVSDDRSLRMTTAGRDKAIAVMRKHRLAEQLLSSKLGLDIHKVHLEACRWEHVMSDDVELRLVEVLDEFRYSPFGNPIPGLERLGVDPGDQSDIGVRCTDLPQAETLRCRIVQFHEILQVNDDQFRRITDANIWVDSVVDVRNEKTQVFLCNDGKEVPIEPDLSHAIRVERLF